MKLLPENFISCLHRGDRDVKDYSVTQEGIRSIRCCELQKTGRNPRGIKSTPNVKKEILLQKSGINYTNFCYSSLYVN